MSLANVLEGSAVGPKTGIVRRPTLSCEWSDQSVTPKIGVGSYIGDIICPMSEGAMAVEMVLRIWDVEHGACAMLQPVIDGVPGRLAMIDAGHSADFRPSHFIRQGLGRTELDYLFITNVDQDHISDLHGIVEAGVNVRVLHRNPHVSVEALRVIKEQGGPITKQAELFLHMHGTYSAPVSAPFDTSMGGITATCFHNAFPRFIDTNNLSLVVFIKFGTFKILFPGDIERNGWLALLENHEFVSELAGTTILVASHHGRENGYCEEVFDIVRPAAVVMSDKSLMHDTQLMAGTYGNVTWPEGVMVATTRKRRRVLTTRTDGHIIFTVNGVGEFKVETELAG